jgi:hypothetical protein
MSSTLADLARRIIKLLLPLLCLLATQAQAESDNITFFLEDEPVYTSSAFDNPGFMRELVTEMTQLMGITPTYRFEPWKRAQALAIRTPNAIIFPLARTPEREPHYRWLCPIIEIPMSFTTTVAPPIDTVSEARALGHIGVIIGTPHEDFLRQNDITLLAFTAETLYPALAGGRIKSIYTARPEAVYSWKHGGYPGKLIFGATQQTLTLWIAASREGQLIDAQAWTDSLEKIKRNGHFERIRKAYFELPERAP